MVVAWYRRDRAAVVAALRAGQRPDLATTMGCGPLDELVALHAELGIFAALDALPVARERAGLPDQLLLRTLATLPFVQAAALSAAAEVLFREPAILLQVGWAPVQIRAGDNDRHRHPDGRQPESLPCHPDTLRDELRRVGEAAWERAQRAGVGTLYARGLVRGKVYAIDGTGLGAQLRVVALVCVSGSRPLIVAWRLLEGSASEKGKEAAVTRTLVEQALELGGPGCMRLLLADALDADGPLLAWLKYAKGIDALVRLPQDRRLYADIKGMADAGLLAWTEHQYTQTLQGHKRLRTVAVTSVGTLTSWDSFVAATTTYGHADAPLWACLIEERTVSTTAGADLPVALVSTRPWADGFAALQAFRPRWQIEDEGNRELKEGFGLEAQRWGRDVAAVRGRVTVTCLAFNTTQVYRSQAGQRVATRGIRRLRRLSQPQLGAAPVVVDVGGVYGVFALEEVLAELGAAVRESLLPAPAAARAPVRRRRPPHSPDPPRAAA
jgi:hypothetical protein